MEPITVALPLGIGDSHWSCQKLASLKRHHQGAPIHAYINESENHKTVGYMDIMPCVDKALFSKKAPYCITTEMPGTYRHPRYGTLEGCRNWNGFDYVFVANHAMESGMPIHDWIPELDTEYGFEYFMPIGTENKSLELMPEPTVLLYPSGMAPNSGFHNYWWKFRDWAEVIQLLNDAGVEPLLVGANTKDDLRYASRLVRRCRGLNFQNAVGKTSIPDYVRLIERARGWMGLNSGGGIVSASALTPTVMFWADKRWPVGGASFNPEMQTAWLHPEEMSNYRTLSYGDPKMTPFAAANAMMNVIR